MTNSHQDFSPLSPAKQQLLRKLLLAKRASRSASPHQTIPHLEQEYAPLSFAQQRLWFLEQLEASHAPYNMSGANRLHGSLHLEILVKSVQEIMYRHTILRTTFVNQDGHPLQHIRDSLHITIPLIDLTSLPRQEQERETARLARSEPQAAFDFGQGPLFRMTLLRLRNNEHVLLATFHHIIADAWSLGIFMSEFSAFYTALQNQHRSPADQATRLPDLPIQYSDFARWQRERVQGERFQKQLDYWRQQLAGSSGRAQAPFLQLPTDRPRPAIQSFAGAKLSRLLPPDLHQQLKSLSQRQNVTLFMTGLAAFLVLLMRYSGQSDIVVGSPITQRTEKELEGLIGFFINMLVLHTDLSGNPTFQQFLDRVRQVVVQAYAHQDVPFEKLVENIQPERHLSYQPLFQVSFSLLDVPAAKWEMPGVTFYPMEVEQTTAQFDLSLTLHEVGSGPVSDGLLTTLEYNTDLFDVTTMERFLEHWQVLLEALVHDPGQQIERYSLLTPEEQARLVQWNTTKTDYPQDRCVHQLVELQVERTPDAIAVVFEEVSLTYAELNRRANQLAHRLQDWGVGPEVLVGICCERSVELVVSLLAVLKAGGAYVPLDPGLPQERLAYMIQDAQVTLLLTQSHLQESLSSVGVTLMVVDVEMQGPADNPRSLIQPDHPIYMIYTSGSTGMPKGVVNTHRSLCNCLLWMQQTYPLTHEDRMLQKTPFSFDVSFWEFFWPLLTGASLIVARSSGHLDPTYLKTLMARQQVTILHFVPSMLQVLLYDEPSREGPHLQSCTSLRRVICIGEALSTELQALFFAHVAEEATLHNLYGPTEAAIQVTFWQCQRSVERAAWRVPIGRPIANTQIYLLDRHLQPVPLGVTGELYIGGIGLARGYGGHADLTAERFIPNPFVGATPHGYDDPYNAASAGSRLYRTGDLARYRADGAIEYLGRVDHQVKIRGFRIELSEIEIVLLKHPNIKDCVVSLWEATPDDRRLVSYVVTEDHKPISTGELRRYLQGKFPKYMVPAFFVLLEELPLTPNGKLDRAALPIPDQTRLNPDTALVSPRTPSEEVLAAIWCSVLGREVIGIHENFFELGGDSIRCIQVLAQARQRGLYFSLQQLFQQQTIAELVQVLGSEAQRELLTEPLLPFSLLAPQDRWQKLDDRFPADVEDAYPLMMLQVGMIFHNQYASTIYHDIFSYHLAVPCNPQLLQTALARLVASHPILRTSFDLSTFSEPLQLVHPSVALPMQIQDLSMLSSAEQHERLRDWLEQEKSRPFVWTQAPLFHFQIHLRSECSFQLTLSFSHAILDGWSVASLLTEFMKVYLSLLSGDDGFVVAPPKLLFRDFVALERKVVASQEARHYWLEKLQGFTSASLPRWTYAQRAVAETAVYALPVSISEETSSKLKSIAHQLAVPLKSVLLAAHLRVLGLLHGQRDILTGLVSNGRPEVPDGERTLGLFLNTLPLRMRLSDGTWSELIREVFAAECEMLPYRWYPLAEIQKQTDIQAPFETLFNFMHFHVYHELLSPQYTVGNDTSFSFQVLGQDIFESTNFALVANFSLDLISSQIRILLQCDPNVFCIEQIHTIAGYYAQALMELAAEPAGRYQSLSLLSVQEREQILVEWNATQANYPQDQSLHQLFEQQVAQTPEAIAVGFEEQQLSYQQLNQQANLLAHQLCQQGIGPDMLVGVCMERSLSLVVALLAVLKAGGAYVPLDPSYPQERLTFLLEDAQVSVVLTQAHLCERLACSHVEFICVPSNSLATNSHDYENLASFVQPDNLAYMIYTSGSTGRPKGAMNTHRAINNRLHWMQRAYQLNNDDRVLQKTPFSFDVSVWEFFWPLLTGARLIMARPAGHQDPTYLRRLIVQEQVTTLHFVPSMLQAFLWDASTAKMPHLESCTSLRRVICSGEALSAELQARFFARFAEGVELHNLYGPTEAAIDVTYWSCQRGSDESSVPIGRPIANTQIYLLDRDLQPVPIGVPGELYIGGVGLARGYHCRPELTAERFMPNPFVGIVPCTNPGERLYRTGDLARYRTDGAIECLGRIDQQVKIRGFRIELGEIEEALLKYPDVREVVVSVREEVLGDKRLVAYVVKEGVVQLTTDEMRQLSHQWRARLQAQLPDHMIPAHFVLLQELPHMPNGKVDRVATGLLPIVNNLQPDSDSAVALARTPTAEILAAIWSSVLGRAQVGIHESFFALGGDSMRSIQVVFQARERGIHFSLQQLLRQQTIYQLVQVVGTETQGMHLLEPVQPFSLLAAQDLQGKLISHGLPDDVEDAYPLTMLQAGMLFHSQLDPASAIYHDIFSFHLGMPYNLEHLQTALERLAASHTILRTSFDLRSFSEPLQLVHRSVQIPVQTQDLRMFSPTEQDEQLAAWFEGEKNCPFVWTHPPLLRLQIHLRSETSFQLTLSFHHAILDGWSVAALLTELMKNYISLLSGDDGSFAVPPAMQFRDFVALERRLIASQEAKEYWQRSLHGATGARLPRWSSVQATSETSVYVLPVPISTETSAGLKSIAQRIAVPLKSVLLAAHLKVLSLLHGQTDVLTGLVCNGRPEVADAERTLGLFLNTLPLRMKLSGGTWSELIRETFAIECESLPYRWYPLIEIQRQRGTQALFETIFNFNHFYVYQDLLEIGKGITPFSVQVLGSEMFEKTNFALTANFSLDLVSSQISLALQCDTRALSVEQIQTIGDYYAQVLAELAHEPDGRYERLAPGQETGPIVQGNVTRHGEQAPVSTAQTFLGYVAPQSELERRIAEIWREVLRLEQVGIYDNFFDLGGHSLLLMQVCNKLQTYYEVSMTDMFHYPTIHALSTYLSEQQERQPMLYTISERVKKRKERAYQKPKRTRERIK